MVKHRGIPRNTDDLTNPDEHFRGCGYDTLLDRCADISTRLSI